VTSTGHLQAPETPAEEPQAGKITYLEAITAALRDAMGDDDRVFLLGEDIGVFGGAFGVTAGLLEAGRKFPWRDWWKRRVLRRLR